MIETKATQLQITIDSGSALVLTSLIAQILAECEETGSYCNIVVEHLDEGKIKVLSDIFYSIHNHI